MNEFCSGSKSTRYRLPKHIKTIGKILVDAATRGEQTLFYRDRGGRLIDEFAQEFYYAASDLLRCNQKILNSFSRFFDAINSGRATDCYRALGRLDSAIVSLVDVNLLAHSYELENVRNQGIEQSGLDLLISSTNTLFKSVLKYEKEIGQRLIDAEKLVNINPGALEGCTLKIKLDFDTKNASEKLEVLIDWFKSYKRNHAPVFKVSADNNFVEKTIDPFDAAVLGYVYGSVYK